MSDLTNFNCFKTPVLQFGFLHSSPFLASRFHPPVIVISVFSTSPHYAAHSASSRTPFIPSALNFLLYFDHYNTNTYVAVLDATHPTHPPGSRNQSVLVSILIDFYCCELGKQSTHCCVKSWLYLSVTTISSQQTFRKPSSQQSVKEINSLKLSCEEVRYGYVNRENITI